MPLFGAHMSIAGGYYKAAEAAARCGMNTVQLFTKNNNQWRAKPISDEDIAQFQGALEANKITLPLSHASYLINLASPDEALFQKSVQGFAVELERAHALGIPAVVVHPGAYIEGDEQDGIARVAQALNQIHGMTKSLPTLTLLECTAGQGTCLGADLKHLGAIRSQVKKPERVEVCLDTCHLFAAGYDLRTKAGYRAMIRELDDSVGLERVRGIHLNDSVKDLGSRVDRHAHIGEGKLGREGFEQILNDRHFRQVPMYLETPKGEREGVDLDVINLGTVKSLIRKR